MWQQTVGRYLVLRIRNQTERLVVVVAVEPHVGVGFGPAADDDASFSPVVEARGVHGVAAVVAVAFFWEDAFVVAEVSAVFTGVFVGSAGEDVLDDGFGFAGEGVDGARLILAVGTGSRRTARLRRRTRSIRARIRPVPRQIHPEPPGDGHEGDATDDRHQRFHLRSRTGPATTT